MSPRGRTCLVSRLPELPPCLPTRQPGAPRVTRLTDLGRPEARRRPPRRPPPTWSWYHRLVPVAVSACRKGAGVCTGPYMRRRRHLPRASGGASVCSSRSEKPRGRGSERGGRGRRRADGYSDGPGGHRPPRPSSCSRGGCPITSCASSPIPTAACSRNPARLPSLATVPTGR